jgi:CRP/FNR family nitrogen fixation transcriptional regulator
VDRCSSYFRCDTLVGWARKSRGQRMQTPVAARPWSMPAGTGPDVRSRHLFGRARRHGPPALLQELAGSIERMGAPVSFARNAEIYGDKEPADHLYKVISGTVRTCRTLVDGRRQVGAFYLPGDMFGLESGPQRAFSAEAVVHTVALVANRNIVDSPVARESGMAREVWDLMAHELQRTQDHLYLLIKTAPERVASFLLEMARRFGSGDEVELSMSRQDVADYLGLTIETVSRTLTQLEHAGVISLPTSRRIVLRNRAILKRLVA